MDTLSIVGNDVEETVHGMSEVSSIPKHNGSISSDGDQATLNMQIQYLSRQGRAILELYDKDNDVVKSVDLKLADQDPGSPLNLTVQLTLRANSGSPSSGPNYIVCDVAADNFSEGKMKITIMGKLGQFSSNVEARSMQGFPTQVSGASYNGNGMYSLEVPFTIA